MARYHFHTQNNGVKVVDAFGDECRDDEEIQDNAVGILIAMAQEELPGGDQKDFRIEVVDEGGSPVFRAELVLRSRWVRSAASGSH